MFYFFSYITTLFCSYFLTSFLIKIGRKFDITDNPQKRKQPARTHKGSLPRLGGLGIGIALLIGIIIFVPINSIVIGICAGIALSLLSGFLDDLFDVSPYIRFVLNILIAGFVILSGLGVPYLSNPFGEPIRLDMVRISLPFMHEKSILLFADIFAVIWLVMCMNFVNWSKGIDGQLPGFVSIAALFMAVLALRFSDHDISAETVFLLGLITSAAFLGFLPLNFYPQKILPGYAGGSLAGLMLGILSILSWGKLGTMIMVLSIPLIDASYVFISRVIRKRSPFRGDSNHLHHRLLDIGWGRRRIAFFYWITTAIFGVASIVFSGLEKILSIFAVFIITMLFVKIVIRKW